MKNPTTVELIEMTPGEAKRILKECRYPRQRTLKQRQLTKLETAMRNGTFVPSSPIVFARLGGKEILVNGYHTLTSVENSNQTVTLSAMWYNVATPKELDTLYCTLDSTAIRSTGDQARALGFSERSPLNDREAAKVLTALKWIAADLHSIKVYLVDSKTQQSYFDKYISEVREYANIVHSNVPRGDWRVKHMWAAPTVTVALLSLKLDKEFASEFWTVVAQGTAPTKNPAREMLEWQQRKEKQKARIRLEDRIATLCWLYVKAKEGAEVAPASIATQDGSVEANLYNEFVGAVKGAPISRRYKRSGATTKQ